MRRVARAALPGFGIEASDLALLNHGENTTYRVDRRWMLRVCRPGYQTDASLRSEGVWLRSLRDAGMGVPEPVAAVGGGTMVTVEVPGVPGPRRCVVFRWMPGRFGGWGLTRGQLRAIGRATAELHRNGDAFVPPPGFERPRGDWAGLLGAEAVWGDPLGERSLDAQQLRVLAAARDRLRDDLAGLPTTAPHFGLIHADLHMWNVLFQDGRACLIDFEDTLLGYRMFDATVTLRPWMSSPDFASREAAWLEGYRSVRALSTDDFAQWRRFLPVAALRRLAWVRTRSDVPRIAATMPSAIASGVAVCRDYLGI